jgi:hypothetical protein
LEGFPFPAEFGSTGFEMWDSKAIDFGFPAGQRTSSFAAGIIDLKVFRRFHGVQTGGDKIDVW